MKSSFIRLRRLLMDIKQNQVQYLLMDIKYNQVRLPSPPLLG